MLTVFNRVIESEFIRQAEPSQINRIRERGLNPAREVASSIEAACNREL